MEGVGVVMSCLATLAGSLGDNCVKYAYNMVEREGLSQEAWTCCDEQYILASFIWCIGWTCTIVLNSVLNALSLMWAPASLVIPMSAMHIVWNVGLAKLINSESISWWVLGCTGLNVVGILGILIGAPKIDPKYDQPDDVAALVLDPIWVVYKLAVLSVLAYVVIQRFFPGVIRTITRRNSPRAERTAGMLLPGLCASFTFAYFKVLMEMASTEKGDTPFDRLSFWGLVALLAPFAVTQIWSLNLSLSMYDASKAIPLYASTLIVMGSINGMILFKEYNNIGVFYKWVFFLLGVAIAVSAIFMNGMGTVEKGDEEKEAESVQTKECRPPTCIELPEIPKELALQGSLTLKSPDGRSCCGGFGLFGFPVAAPKRPTATPHSMSGRPAAPVDFTVDMVAAGKQDAPAGS